MRFLLLSLLLSSASANAQNFNEVWAELLNHNEEPQQNVVTVPNIDWSVPVEMSPIHNIISGESIRDIQDSQMLEGGSSFGIGGDTRDKRHGTAWFYGNAPIKLCYSLGIEFGASESQVRLAVTNSINSWKSYFTKKKINEGLQVPINTNFVLQGPCVGGEDLRLYFGTGPIWQNLSDLKAVQSLERPVAYYNKTHLSTDMRWSKGYIRFVSHGYYESGHRPFPNWKTAKALETFVAHELGHILGFQHSHGTLMTGNIVEESFLKKGSQPKTTIDQSLELMTCLTCPNAYVRTDRSNKNDFGFSHDARLLLSSKGEMAILDQGRKWSLRLHRTGTVQFEEVLHTNFDTLKRMSSQVLYASLEVAPDELVPVIVELQSLQKIRITTFVEGDYKQIGVFHAR